MAIKEVFFMSFVELKAPVVQETVTADQIKEYAKQLSTQNLQIEFNKRYNTNKIKTTEDVQKFFSLFNQTITPIEKKDEILVTPGSKNVITTTNANSTETPVGVYENSYLKKVETKENSKDVSNVLNGKMKFDDFLDKYSLRDDFNHWLKQKLDTAKATVTQQQDTAKPEKKKTFVLQPKFMARAYGAAQEPAIAAGLEVSKDIGIVSIGATGAAAFGGKKLLAEEASIWAGVQVGKSYLVGYAYGDKFYNVDVAHPGFGIAAKYPIGGIKVKAGFEKGYDYACQYDKVILPSGVSFGITTLFWGDNVGYGAPIGKLQRYGVSMGIDSKVYNVPINVAIQYTQPSGDGQNGLQLRLTLNP